MVSVVGPREVQLTWPSPGGPDIVGYHVERAVVEVFSEDQVVRLKKDTLPLAEPSVGTIKAIGAFTRSTKKRCRPPRLPTLNSIWRGHGKSKGEPIFSTAFATVSSTPMANRIALPCLLTGSGQSMRWAWKAARRRIS